MTARRFYGARPPGITTEPLPGRLIVLEGVDGVGRSTQIALLQEWLEHRGFAVIQTGLTRSMVAGRGIQRAKRGNTLDPITLNLLYATDFWDRLERQIVPALHAGMVALADRYIFSLIARARVRGLSGRWLRDLYDFALVPDRVIYLDIDVEQLLPRVLAGGGFDYWESGQDYLRDPNLYQNFIHYQEALLKEFRRLARANRLTTIDARGSVSQVFTRLKSELEGMLDDMAAEPLATGPALVLPSAARSQAPQRLRREQPV